MCSSDLVLPDRQIAGQRRIDRGEIGQRQRPCTMPRDVETFDDDAAGRRLQHAEHHVDGRGLAGPIRAEQADNLATTDLERAVVDRSEEHTSDLQSLMRTSYAVFRLQKQKQNKLTPNT